MLFISIGVYNRGKVDWYKGAEATSRSAHSEVFGPFQPLVNILQSYLLQELLMKLTRVYSSF